MEAACHSDLPLGCAVLGVKAIYARMILKGRTEAKTGLPLEVHSPLSLFSGDHFLTQSLLIHRVSF